MRRFQLGFIFLLMPCLLMAQKGYNIYLSMTPTVTFGTVFSDGTTKFVSPDNKTGANTIYPLYSVLDSRPDGDNNPFHIFGKKFSYGVILESYLSEKHSFNTGIEFGSRGYKVISASSVSSLISYRNWCFPFYFSRYKWLGTYWTLKYNFGGSLNYAYSTPKSNRVVEINRFGNMYPLLGGGLEMAYMGKEGKLSFELAYYQGWQNVIDHTYIGVDNKYGERIRSNASTLRLVMKYNFQRLNGFKRKKKDRAVSIEIPVEQTLGERFLKTPEVLEVDSDTLSFCFIDDQTIDGDSILIMWNDSIVSNAFGLSKEEVCFQFVLQSGRNRLVVHAINEGTIRPNTYEIRVLETGEKHVIRMKSDMKNSAVLDIRRKRY